MKKPTTTNRILKLRNILSLCGMMLIGLIGVIYELLGHGHFQKLCNSLGIPDSFRLVWICGIITLLLFAGTSIVMNRLK